ncbi:S4 domain protein [Ancylostoma caninum]|uniref:U3 small nucleolar ribonucleoprotein protein IMP3 n=2 Tax=Ancylostoma caninum TaxID=29170 RepID=A0A368F8Q6_ANCCA|nr:S4 domain protein [Ancylostoma caninum]
MVRKLKLHERKLLKKTDFMQWEVDQQGKQSEQMRKYHITKREHYSLYNRLAAEVRSIAEKLKELPQNEPFRVRTVREMLSKLYAVGVIPTADTAERLHKVTAASFARRRLPVVMKNIGMVDSIRGASDFVEQGHVRIGPKLVTDPAFVVTRAQEDAITWTNASKIKRHVLDYNNARDDFDLA